MSQTNLFGGEVSARGYLNPVRDREAWVEARTNGIGGSDAGVLMRWNQYASVTGLWEEKVGLSRKPFESNRFIEWGNLLEPILLARYAEERGVWVLGRDLGGRPVRFPPDTSRMPHYLGDNHPLTRWLNPLVSPTRPYARANVDGFDLGEHGRFPVAALEAKTTGQDNGPKWDWYPPPTYLAQCLHNREVLRDMGLDIPFRIMVLIGGNNFGWMPIGEHPEYVVELRAREKRFWDCVESVTKPSVARSFPRMPTPEELEEEEQEMGGFNFPSTALGGKRNIPEAPVGTHVGICVGVIDRGMQESTFQGETKERHRMSVHWILPDEEIPEIGTDGQPTGDLAGRPHMVSSWFTVSLNERSSFRAFLKNLRGRDINAQEEEWVRNGTFNPADLLIGANALLTIIHKEKKDGEVRAEISSAAPLMKGMQARPIPEDFIDWEPGKNRQESEEQESFTPPAAKSKSRVTVPDDTDDDMPF